MCGVADGAAGAAGAGDSPPPRRPQGIRHGMKDGVRGGIRHAWEDLIGKEFQIETFWQ